MQLNQLTALSKSAKISAKTHKVTQLLAIGGLAIVTAALSTAPAQAAIVNGSIAFQGGTSDFYNQNLSTPGNQFSVDFNNASKAALVTGATANLSSFFPTPIAYTVAPDTGNFTYKGVSAANTFDYTLTKNLKFAFNNGVDLTVKAGSIFQGGFNNSNGVEFGLLTDAGSFFTQGGVDTQSSLAFSFNDVASGGGGGYTVNAASVPEPFTVIGTIIGGTVAFRMKKKLLADNSK